MIVIKKTISPNHRSDLNDVRTIKSALLSTGHYEIPSYGLTPYADTKLFSAIQAFQSENNLNVDATIRPNGETLHAINNSIIHEKNNFARSPSTWCPQCGGPHGGSKGDLCPDCSIKQ